jgi:hypothetical protein
LFPEFAEFLKMEQGSTFVVDGEIVADTGEFNDVAGRMHLRDKLFIRIASQSNPCTFVIFDCIETTREEPRPFADRYKLVHIHKALKNMEKPMNVEIATISDKPSKLLRQAKKEGWEGIVLKKRLSTYYGGRSFDWRKVKLFKEVHHSFIAYEDHPRGVLLIDGDRKVNVNGTEAELVKNAIKENGEVVVEVQYLPQNNSSKWRFPSYRGVVKEGANESKRAHK